LDIGSIRYKAEKRYKEFVEAGIRGKGLWKEVRGQSVLGEGMFFEKVLHHVKAHEDMGEIPKRQRYVGRPALAEILPAGTQSEKGIKKTVLDFGYTQKEVAECLGVTIPPSAER
jgi:hypothetical protein